MKKTYTGTLTHPDLAQATIHMIVFTGCKYHGENDTAGECDYTGVTSWDIIEGGTEAEEIEKDFGEAADEYHEYLVLHFNDGSEATFRNSHVAMFIW